MNPQTQSPHGEKPDHDPGTPVIIKTGGNPSGSNKVQVTIDSPAMSFTKFVQTAEGVWVSHSTLKGRINKLSVFDGIDPKPQDEKQPYPEQLASITIQYGLTQSLTVRETGNIADHEVALEITAVGASFADTSDEWNTASDTFEPPSHVGFMGGNRILLNKDLTDTDPSVHIYFAKPTVG